MRKRLKVAIVGASGLVGRTVLKVLEEKDFPDLQYTLFSSNKSAGKEICLIHRNYIVRELNEKSFDERF